MFRFIKGSTLFLSVTGAFLFACIVGPSVSVQSNQEPPTTPVSTRKTVGSAKINSPKFTEYRGVRIGMNADEARKKLGNPKEKTKNQDFFIFSDNESAQIFYDEQQKIYAISIDFKGKQSAPTPPEIFGQEIMAKPDGSIYHMQQYVEVGFWLAYNRMAGDSPLITVTMQRIP
jgi:hypothetical protein